MKSTRAPKPTIIASVLLLLISVGCLAALVAFLLKGDFGEKGMVAYLVILLLGVNGACCFAGIGLLRGMRKAYRMAESIGILGIVVFLLASCGEVGSGSAAHTVDGKTYDRLSPSYLVGIAYCGFLTFLLSRKSTKAFFTGNSTPVETTESNATGG